MGKAGADIVIRRETLQAACGKGERRNMDEFAFGSSATFQHMLGSVRLKNRGTRASVFHNLQTLNYSGIDSWLI